MTQKAHRILALDVLRGIAVILMVQQHLIAWLWDIPWQFSNPPVSEHPVLLTLSGMGGFAAPIFLVLVGVGTHMLWLNRSRPDPVLIKRGLGILVFGYILNLLAPGWFNPGSWYVLHLIGAGYLLAPLFCRMPDKALLITMVAVLLLAPALQSFYDLPERLSNSMMDNDDGPAAVLRLALAGGNFPLFPWMFMVLAGNWAGRIITGPKDETGPNFLQPERLQAIRRISITMALTGVFVYSLALTVGRGFESGYVSKFLAVSLLFFPASPSLMLLLCAAALLALYVGIVFDLKRPVSKNNFFVLLGKASLTIILFHIPVFREGGKFLEFYRTFGKLETIAIIAGFVIIASILIRFWQKAGLRFGPEWLLRKISG